LLGANSGIGYETAALLATNPDYHILVCARSAEKGEQAVASLQASNPSGSFSTLVLDITDQTSITAAFEYVSKEYGKLDVLVNNAGIICWSPVLIDNLRQTFETNTFGHAVMTETFTPLLEKSPNARLVYVTSGLGSITDRVNPKDPFYMLQGHSYRMSKTALNMLAACHHVSLGPKGVKVWTYDPGYVVTNLSGTGEKGRNERIKAGAGSPVGSAEGIVELVLGKRDEDVGKFVKKGGFYGW
jgi:NAD(P)-dependent dehydrogenase (short-subunit alcohol dehydrogenase family)